MSIYYIKTNAGDIFTLDATESFEFSESGSLTEYTIESGAKVSDHYVNENKVISLSGVISDFKLGSKTSPVKTTGDFIQKILKLKENREPFKVYYRGVVAGSGGNTQSEDFGYFDNIMFQSISFSQDAAIGASSGRYAYRVSMQLKQITFSTRATVGMENIKAPNIALKAEEKKTAVAVNTLPPGIQAANKQVLEGNAKKDTPAELVYVRDNLSKFRSK